MKKEIIIKLDNQDVVIKKLPIGKYAEFFLAIEELPKQFQDLDASNKDNFLSQLPKLLATATPEVIKLTAIASGLEIKEVNKLGLAEVTDLIAGALEVNNFDKIVENIKKIMARKPKPEIAEDSIGLKTGSTEPLTS